MRTIIGGGLAGEKKELYTLRQWEHKNLAILPSFLALALTHCLVLVPRYEPPGEIVT